MRPDNVPKRGAELFNNDYSNAACHMIQIPERS